VARLEPLGDRAMRNPTRNPDENLLLLRTQRRTELDRETLERSRRRLAIELTGRTSRSLRHQASHHAVRCACLGKLCVLRRELRATLHLQVLVASHPYEVAPDRIGNGRARIAQVQQSLLQHLLNAHGPVCGWNSDASGECLERRAKASHEFL